MKGRFDVHLEQQRDRLAAQWGPAGVPPTRQWPDVVLTRARLARDLGSPEGVSWPVPQPVHLKAPLAHAPAAPYDRVTPLPAVGGSISEARVADVQRALLGRLDRIENRDGEYVVVDLKSGVGMERGELAERHRDQMLFYAGLFQSAYATWPLLELIPVDGAPIAVTFTPADVDAVRAAAQSDRDMFNSAITRSTVSESVVPSPARCAWCPFQVVCPALISHWAEATGDVTQSVPRGISLAVGAVLSMRRSASAVDVVIDQHTALTAPSGAVNVTRLPAGLQVQVGDQLVVSGVMPAGGAHVLRAQWNSPVRVVPATQSPRTRTLRA